MLFSAPEPFVVTMKDMKKINLSPDFLFTENVRLQRLQRNSENVGTFLKFHPSIIKY